MIVSISVDWSLLSSVILRRNPSVAKHNCLRDKFFEKRGKNRGHLKRKSNLLMQGLLYRKC